VNGLSSFDTLEAATEPGGTAQCIDLSCLAEGGLGGFRDPNLEGHVLIRPLTPGGMEDWLASRAAGTFADNPYTQFLQRIVERVKRPR